MLNPSQSNALLGFLGTNQIVLASNNQGKIAEFARLLNPLGLTILPQGDLNIPAAKEPFTTFIENALTKARHASAASGLPSLADDSGVCVTALNYAPGVISARYAGVNATDAQNNAQLIHHLQGITDRRAHYVCALALIRSPQDPEPMIVCAQWHGAMIDVPRGTEGFGYDPHFYLSDLNQTAAELTQEQKNTISHRAIATAQLIDQLLVRIHHV